MSKLRNELSAILEKILHVYVLAQDTYLYTEYLHNPETQAEKDLVIHSAHSRHLRFIMHLLFRTLVTEVCKLYKNTGQEKFSILSFVDALSPAGHLRKIGVPVPHMEKWKRCLSENQPTTNKIILLRDREYAHTDDPTKSYSGTELSFKDIKVLLDLAAEILQEIYRDVFDTDLLLDSPTFDRDKFSLLKLLAKAEKQRLDESFKSTLAECLDIV